MVHQVRLGVCFSCFSNVFPGVSLFNFFVHLTGFFLKYGHGGTTNRAENTKHPNKVYMANVIEFVLHPTANETTLTCMR